MGIVLDPNLPNSVGPVRAGTAGYVTTYAQVAAKPMLHAGRATARRALVILDEVHHAGDGLSWGDAVYEAFERAARRLCLTGTPFRTRADERIPFVRYTDDGEGNLASTADYTYGYREALADGVVRPVVFLAYSGEASWRTSAGEEFTARLGEPLTAEQNARAWRTALDPAGEWIPAVLQAADTRLSQVRQSVPDAGGLVIATDQESARAYAKILERISGEMPTLVLSDDPKASGRIKEFSETNERWIVAVRMVSEGVDVPRLAVGVYATSASTPLFFAQAIGRYVRARKKGETASVFLPSVPVLLELASELEAQRDHVLGKPHREKEGWEDELLAQANRTEDEPGEEEKAFTSLGASAELDQVIYDGNSFGTAVFSGSDEEQEYLGLPGLLEPDQVRALLRKRQEEQIADEKRRKPAKEEAPPPTARPQSVSERLGALRKELNALVGMYHHRTKKPHGAIHNELRRVCGGPVTAMATVEQLEERIVTLRSW
jgi:superfamily II DNA or RNA helicase